MGGYVNSPKTLSQSGECWISEHAKVYGSVSISGNAYIGNEARVFNYRKDLAITVSGNAVIVDKAQVLIEKVMGFHPEQNTFISGEVKISNNAVIANAGNITDNAEIFGNAHVNGSVEISGCSRIFGAAELRENTKVKGKSSISGSAVLHFGCTVENSTVPGRSVIDVGDVINNAVFDEAGTMVSGTSKLGNRLSHLNSGKPALYSGAITAGHMNAKLIGQHTLGNNSTQGTKTVKSELTIETKDALNLLDELKADIAAYESDIVKVIKYPVMTDKTDPFTLELMVALKLATRLALNPTHKDFIASVFDLEKKFLAAESNALKIASARLDENGLKKTKRAKDLFAIAANEASSDQERKAAFVQGFKQLEGVIAVPEVAVDAFRVKIGLLEIEM